MACEFRFEHNPSVSFEWAAGGIVTESSIGTWDPNLSTMREGIEELGAKVFQVDRKNNRVKIAYPQVLFEAGNRSQVLSSIAGNIFGLNELTRLKLLDVTFPKRIVERFSGPKLGLSGIKELARVEGRPLVGTIVKPKLGLSEKEHSEVACNAWCGGLDLVKDDENLTDMVFNRFDDGIPEALARRDKAEKETGEKKLDVPNITASLSEMKRRADLVIEHGGRIVMIDILTAGWSALQEMRNYLDGKGVEIHAHGVQHGAYTRLERHDISMLTIAKFARLVGVDNLHAGTAVGKMKGEKREILNTHEFLKSNLYGLKRTTPVALGGLHRGLVNDLMDIFGTDILVQAGGDVYGHPDGTENGARATRQAVEACTKGMELQNYAEDHSELARALDKWKQGDE